MTLMPDALAELLADFATISDRNERAELLIEMADRFAEVKVAPAVAVPPYDEKHRAPHPISEVRDQGSAAPVIPVAAHRARLQVPGRRHRRIGGRSAASGITAAADSCHPIPDS